MNDYHYERNPKKIYRQSFETILQEADLAGYSGPIRSVVVRLIHACGMTDITDLIRHSPDVIGVATKAFDSGAPIFSDVEMVASGVIRKFLPAKNDVICTLNEPGVSEHAKEINNTRSAAAVDFWGDQLTGAIVAIGNAPTALFKLMDNISSGGPIPAVILGFPVGFVGAAESKQRLAGGGSKTEFITLLGRRGGSALASAAVNALASIQDENTQCPDIG